MIHYTEGIFISVSSFKEFPRSGLIKLPKMLHKILPKHCN